MHAFLKVEIVHRIEFPALEIIADSIRLDLTRLETAVGQLTDLINDTNTQLDAAIDRAKVDFDALMLRIAALEAKVADGVATPEDLAMIAAIRDKAANFDPDPANPPAQPAA